MNTTRFKQFFASIALGVATTLCLLVVLTLALGASSAADLVFGYGPGVLVVIFAVVWYPFVRRRLK
jgi:hypothetical protein